MRVSLFAYCSLRKGFAAPFKRSIHGYASTTAGLLPQRRHTAPPCQYCPGLPSIHPQTISAPCFALPYAIYGTTPVRRSIQTSFFSHHIFLADRNARSAVRLPACTSYLFIINILFTFIITFATLAKIFSAYFLPIPHTVRPAARTR